ncbi:MAG: hypothetical protein ACI9VR_001695 [Cognaticolwellia sp.]|jgi:hypothetical protein
MLLLLSALTFSQESAPGPASVERPPPVLTQAQQDRSELEGILAGAAVLSGAERVDYFAARVGTASTPQVNAGLARALAASYTMDAPHEAIRDAALLVQRPAAVVPVDPVVQQALAAERLVNMRAYKAERMVVREETEIRGGGSSPQITGGIGGGWGSPMGVPMTNDPLYSVQTWGIYLGKRRLTVPEYLELTDQDVLAQALDLDIQRSKRQSRVLYGIGVAGVVAAGAGVVGQVTTTDAERYTLYRTTATLGVVAAIGGFVGGSIPAARAKELEMEVDFRFTPDQVQPRLDAYNEALRLRIGLSAEDVMLLESVP